MLRTLRSDALLIFKDCSCRSKVSVDLAVEIIPICNYQKCPISGQLAKHFLRKEDHRKAFAGTLGMPEHSELALVVLDLFRGFNRSVHSKVLMVLRNQFCRLALGLAVESEVLDQIKQTRRL